MGDLIKSLLDGNNLFHAMEAVFRNDFLDLRRRKFSFLSATGFVLLLAVLYLGDYEYNRFYFNSEGKTLIDKITNADVFVIKALVVLVISYMAFSFLESRFRNLSAISLTENFAAALVLLGIATACYGMLASHYRETHHEELESINALVNSAGVAVACTLYLCVVFLVERFRKVDLGKSVIKLLIATVAIFATLTGAQYFLFYKSWIG
jgi:hypothetical protein